MNPLLEPSSLPHGAIPFDRLQEDDFLPALEEGIKELRFL
jgi:hypothetical protein